MSNAKTAAAEWYVLAKIIANLASAGEATQIGCGFCTITVDENGHLLHTDGCPATIARQLLVKYGGDWLADHDAALATAVREQCAKVAESLWAQDACNQEGLSIRAAIRAMPLLDADRRDERDDALEAAALIAEKHLLELGHIHQPDSVSCAMSIAIEIRRLKSDPLGHRKELNARDERIRLEARLDALKWARKLTFAQCRDATKNLCGTYEVPFGFMKAFPDRSYIVDADKWDKEIAELEAALARLKSNGPDSNG